MTFFPANDEDDGDDPISEKKLKKIGGAIFDREDSARF